MAEQWAFNPLVQGSNPWGRTMSNLPRREPDWISTAPIVVTRSRRIDASADVVWARIADHETWSEWFTALKSVRVTGEPAAVDGRREVSMSGVTVGEVFTAWEPDSLFAFSVVQAPPILASMAESVALTAEGPSACTITYTQGIEPARGFGWLWRLIAKRMTSELTKALDRLATLATAA
jgi:hypothetical protein